MEASDQSSIAASLPFIHMWFDPDSALVPSATESQEVQEGIWFHLDGIKEYMMLILLLYMVEPFFLLNFFWW